MNIHLLWTLMGIVPSYIYGANLVIDFELKPNNKYQMSTFNNYPKLTYDMTKSPFALKDSPISKESAISTFIDYMIVATSEMFDEIKRSFDKSDIIHDPLDLAKSHIQNRLVTYSKQLLEEYKDKPLSETITLILDWLNEYLHKFINTIKFNHKNDKVMHELSVFKKSAESYICRQFDICRDRQGFTNFFNAVLDEMFYFDNKTLRHVVSKATEIFKTTDYTRALDINTQNKFRQFISELERMTTIELKKKIFLIQYRLNNKDYKPVVCVNGITKVLSPKFTILYRELFNICDQYLRNVEKNKEWEVTKAQIKGFGYDNTKYVQEIMYKAIKLLVTAFKDVVDSADSKTARRIGRIIKSLLSEPYT